TLALSIVVGVLAVVLPMPRPGRRWPRLFLFVTAGALLLASLGLTVMSSWEHDYQTQGVNACKVATSHNDLDAFLDSVQSTDGSIDRDRFQQAQTDHYNQEDHSFDSLWHGVPWTLIGSADRAHDSWNRFLTARRTEIVGIPRDEPPKMT